MKDSLGQFAGDATPASSLLKFFALSANQVNGNSRKAQERVLSTVTPLFTGLQTMTIPNHT